ncbi:DNA-directed RNA polymerase subunit beta [Labeo rohita]|uniref:DNA-directed RNA polymerase subunit beta n=1 Tax=Labeo rohita TaxID=84645 RepID=A0ABQ8MX15_LABRO|nr:DNA-directed RNA polymerase subunit beta [Labeo rohita]
MREAGQRVQPNLSRYTVASIIRTFRNENRTERLPTQGGPERLLSPEQETRVLELEVAAVEHKFIFIDEVGFNLTKRRRRGRNVIGQRAIVEVPGQRGGNITMCAAITNHGVIHHHATLGPYNTAHLITFLEILHNTLIPPDQTDGPEQLRYIVIWDNVSFHRAALVHNWFTAHPPMEDACRDIAVDALHGWIRHARRHFPRCLARANIACDVDEVLWPDRNRREDAA